MVQDGCPRLTFVLVDLALNQWQEWVHVYNTIILVSIAKYDDPLKGICQGTVDFLARQKKCRPSRLFDGISEVWWNLRTFWWIEKIVCIENALALTDFLQKQTRFRVVRARSYLSLL